MMPLVFPYTVATVLDPMGGPNLYSMLKDELSTLTYSSCASSVVYRGDSDVPELLLHCTLPHSYCMHVAPSLCCPSSSLQVM